MVNRARTRAIRERMARTGETFTAAARNHDNERRNPDDDTRRDYRYQTLITRMDWDQHGEAAHVEQFRRLGRSSGCR